MRGHGRIIEYALSSLSRRKLKNLSVAAIFSILIAVLSSILFLMHAYKTETLKLLDSSPEIILQNMSAGRHELIPLEYISTLSGIAGVGKIVPRYWGYYYDSLTSANYTLMAVDADDASDKNKQDVKLINGRIPQTVGECAIGSGVAAIRQIGLNDDFFMTLGTEQNVNLKIVGIFTSNSAIVTNDLVVLTKNDLVKFFNMPVDKATDITIEVNNPSEVTTVARKIRRAYPDSRPILKIELTRTYDNIFNWRGGIVLTMFFGAIAAFMIFVWDKATGINARERQEIGILKAIGWETSDVLQLKFWEGTIVSLSSFLTGLILAYAHVFYFNAQFLAPVLKGWSVLFPKFQPMPYIDLYQIFVLFFLTVVPYVAASIVPSWKAATSDPDAVMR
ncbi:ABC transporter permease [Candidatus Magnetominusculus xianensis]|uniref:ABC transporter permease n=1 Tax=Candidatus Magnetominusculus xianensis TaxID=1748249 RepID=A0ABR5SC83_9BACT|nr:FtsX-like permease family protein [Candidatus Magnetominusculus xianensis]KWT79583.1 ABC transporter permease [Candidatus Magnetominusculus xianensis]MBF0405615.1 FtsX-like permease family protein [Nitrospirota bacterium]